MHPVVARDSKAVARPILPNVSISTGQSKAKKIPAAPLVRVRSKRPVPQESDDRDGESSRRKQHKENISLAPLSSKASERIVKLVAYDGDSDDG